MCGITGAVWSQPGLAVCQQRLAEMTESIRHRGPDDCGSHIESIHRDVAGDRPGVALGFRRLSIIDLAGARQPLSSEDGRVWVVFNGEIYNFRDLRRRLEGAGHTFKTDGDGETIVHLYEDLGVDCFQHLNGMFAIAIWDARRGRLVLGRDRMGQKPLYYVAQPGRIAFGSELKCFAGLQDLRREVDPQAIDEFLTYQYIPHSATIWKGVNKLAPGHYAVFENDHLTVKRYWNIDYSHEQPISKTEVCEQLRTLLSDAVKLRLQADVPLGTFLSGGVDSSLITALAQRQRDEPVRTFSIGFPVKDFDETHYAQIVADKLGTRHQRFEVTPDAVSVIEKLVWHYDEPFGDSSAIPTWYLSELTRREVTVALSGDGGDELFAGYDRYRAMWTSRMLDQVMPMDLLAGSMRWLDWFPESGRQRSFLRRVKRFLEAFGQPPARRFLNWLQIFPETLRAQLYTDSMVDSLAAAGDPFEFFHEAWKRVGDRDVVTRASLADLQTYLPGDLMCKVDIASMAHGLEVRQPMLDYRVVALAASMPVKYKFRGRKGKLILRDAFHDLLPSVIWNRRKMGFGVPIADWFRGPLKAMTNDLLLSEHARISQYLKVEGVRKLVEEHQTGKFNHCYRLWNLLVLEKWLRRWT